MTGGAGFASNHIVDRLRTDGLEDMVIENLSKCRLENTAHHQGRKNFHFVQGDIQNSDLVKSILHEVDAVSYGHAQLEDSLSNL